MQQTFETVLRASLFILTEGAVVERLKSDYGLKMDEHINHAGLVYEAPKELGALYRQYIDIARQYSLPIMLMTPTRRVNAETLEKSGYRDRDVITDCCGFLREIKSAYPDHANGIFLGGLLGCRGNAYAAGEALPSEDAYAFHKVQVTRYRTQPLDYLFAGIMPAVSEAVGMARAMAESGLPYIISFMVRKDGCLLDGTPISEAIRMIDGAVTPQPACYMANCIHPSNLRLALTSPMNRNSGYLSRFSGIQANTSALSPEELDQSGTLHQDDPDDLIREMACLHKAFGFKILGGCCGTDDRFIERLAQLHAGGNE